MPYVYVTLAEAAANEEKVNNRHGRRRNGTILNLQSIDSIKRKRQIL
jgi:hypothetical protein